MLVRRPHLVVYDYGQGGVWAYVWAESDHQIRELYPELTVVDELPVWLGDIRLPSYSANDPAGLLAEIVAARSNEHGAGY